SAAGWLGTDSGKAAALLRCRQDQLINTIVVGRLTHSLPLARLRACPSMSLASPRLHSMKRPHEGSASDTDALQFGLNVIYRSLHPVHSQPPEPAGDFRHLCLRERLALLDCFFHGV